MTALTASSGCCLGVTVPVRGAQRG